MVGVALLTVASPAVAQPMAGPLTIQGLDQFVNTGARSRAMGGTGIAAGNDASALFFNPAALSQLTTFEIRAGGLLNNTMRKQTQSWVPLKNLPGLSVLFEGLSGTIKTPLDTAGNPLSAWITLQKQYDNIGPNWKRSSSVTQPLTLAAALPLTLADMAITVGLGVSQVINLDHYFQNNNSMTPYLGHERPYTTWSNATDTLHVKWYQNVRSREGSVNGVTPGLSMMVVPGLKVGGSVAFLYGSSDDLEQRVERGHLNVAVRQGEAKDFMVDTVYYFQTKKGTSNYKGNVFTFGLLFDQPRYSIGLTIKPSMTLTRTWDRDVTSLDTTVKSFPVRIDSLTSRNYRESGKESVTFPLSYSLGIVLKPTERWIVAFDYVVRNLADAEVTSQSVGTRPWVNNKTEWRLGAEYRVNDLLTLRGGYHQEVAPFSPDGTAIVDEPPTGDVYSVGAGFMVADIMIDVAYEYSKMKYLDIYQSNVNYNARERHQVLVELGYRF
jgi:long-subunit fatty acid transport protein